MKTLTAADLKPGMTVTNDETDILVLGVDRDARPLFGQTPDTPMVRWTGRITRGYGKRKGAYAWLVRSDQHYDVTEGSRPL